MQDRGPEIAKEAYIALGQIDKILSDEHFWKTHRSMEASIRQMAKSEEAVELITELLAEAADTSIFLFGDWTEERDRKHEEMLSAIRKAAQKLAEFIKKQRDQLSLPKILEEKDDYGAIMMPTELLRSLWKLGRTVVNLYDKKEKNPEFEAQAMEVLERSAQWVRYVDRRWGKPPNFDIMPVRPIEPNEKVPF